jgi:hypothetical protein
MLNRRCKSYTFAEYRALTNKEYSFVEKAIDHIKRNKKMYKRLIVITAILINHNLAICEASGSTFSIGSTLGQLIDLLMEFAKWGFMGMGIKKTVEEMLAGANFKQASTSGIQYWLAYIFLQFYPRLFDMIKF